MSAELLMVEQRRGNDDAAHWIREGGRTIPGQDSNRRLDELRAGLVRHERVRAIAADAADEALERALGAMHEPGYLEALRRVGAERPVLMPDFAPPGLDPDIPVDAALVAAAHEGVRTAITAAQRLADGAHFTYAVCRPPGHHAGPDFLGGYCYLNNAAAAAHTLDQAGLAPVGVLDLDLHYPNGTAALVERLAVALHSLHASPVTNVAADTVLPQSERERVVAFSEAPDAAAYLAEVAVSIEELAATAAALVVSLGYDTIAGDPHGSWSFSPAIFTDVLPLLAECSHAFAVGLLGGEER